MYCWGANSHGQLGLGFRSESCENPQQLDALPFDPQLIRTIAAGGGHTLVLVYPNAVYCCGWNNRGQLGLGHTEDVSQFQLIGGFDRFDAIASGWDVSGGLTSDGQIYLWGSNVWQQVASEGVKYRDKPERIELPGAKKATKICFGLRHTVILTDEGTLLLLGKTKWMQNVKMKEMSHEGMQFYELQCSEKIKDVVSGENHLVVKLERGAILCLGDNRFGQSPVGTDLNVHSRHIVKLDSGWSHSGYLTGEGRLYLWGRNNYGQLGVTVDVFNNNQSSLLPLDFEPSKVVDFCLGSQHGMALTENGLLHTWGWNEHGNCGTGGVDNVLTPTSVGGIKPIQKISAGAGFCWAVPHNE
ncbi:secretion-regulating guanine nucleotide exchange factor-like [Uranotaenia lowii]|uniref:secretion-regulating guanine nucleotide exchange factor-like n=1 Tax=Uranotaenia lowii TaxID=190385 RepID=UPI002479B686|nr:secretion-regulating guanine nucleotide exchange factor-like [Uranotaenia lowii]